MYLSLEPPPPSPCSALTTCSFVWILVSEKLLYSSSCCVKLDVHHKARRRSKSNAWTHRHDWMSGNGQSKLLIVQLDPHFRDQGEEEKKKSFSKRLNPSQQLKCNQKVTTLTINPTESCTLLTIHCELKLNLTPRSISWKTHFELRYILHKIKIHLW